MELKEFDIKRLLSWAIKAEMDAQEAYKYLGQSASNSYAREVFMKLVEEEQDHEALLRRHYTDKFPGEGLDLPEDGPVPLPPIWFSDDMDLEAIVHQAMDAEKAAMMFYFKFSKLARELDDLQLLNEINTLVNMEKMHYNLLASTIEEDPSENEALADEEPSTPGSDKEATGLDGE